MTAPVIRQYTDAIPAKGQAQTTFDTNVDSWLDWTTLQFAPDLAAFGTWADQVRAALIAGNLPPLTGRQLDAVRVNAAANGVEFVDVTAAGWALLDDANAAAQRATLGLGSAALMVDSADTDLTVAPDGALRRDIAAAAIAAAIAAAPGRLKHIETITLGSAAATIAVDLPATGYKRFELIYNCAPVNDSISMIMQLKNASTWRTTGYSGRIIVETTIYVFTTGVAVGNGTGSAPGEFGIRGSVVIDGIPSGEKTSISSKDAMEFYSDGVIYAVTTVGAYNTAEAHNAIRLIPSSGNVKAGSTFELWGEPT